VHGSDKARQSIGNLLSAGAWVPGGGLVKPRSLTSLTSSTSSSSSSFVYEGGKVGGCNIRRALSVVLSEQSERRKSSVLVDLTKTVSKIFK